MKEFKIGDTVRVVKHGSSFNGHEFKIVTRAGSLYGIASEEHLPFQAHQNFLELVESKAKEEPSIWEDYL